MLYGQYDLMTDEKNRILIPAEVRRSLDPEQDGEAFFVIIGVNRKPWLYPERRYKALVSKLESRLTPSEDKLAFYQRYFALASWEDWDKQGRMLIPELCRRVEIGREITLIGAYDHYEIWPRAEWLERQEDLIARSDELAAKQREAEEKAMSEVVKSEIKHVMDA